MKQSSLQCVVLYLKYHNLQFYSFQSHIMKTKKPLHFRQLNVLLNTAC